MAVEKKNLKVNPEKCTTCYACQLRCSLAYTGAFNPEKARLIIEPGKITFTDECVNGCSLCARQCVYDAIVRVKEEYGTWNITDMPERFSG